MKFITVEKFLEQSKEIQDVILDWWDYEWCDLYASAEEPWNPKILDKDLEGDIEGDWDYLKTLGYIPLLTEGQLRRFIENKTSGLLEIEYSDLNDDYCFYTIKIFEVKELEYGKEFGKILFDDYIEAEDLLQAYWKVACEIAKEYR